MIQRSFRLTLAFCLLVFGTAACGGSTSASGPRWAKLGDPSREIDVAGNLVFVSQESPARLEIYQRASDGRAGLLKRGQAEVEGQVTAVAGAAMQAFVATDDKDGQLSILDLSDLDDPTVVAIYKAPSGESGTATFFADSVVYLGTMESGTEDEVFILEVTNVGNPQLVTSLEIGEDVAEIHVDGNFAYIGSGKGLHIFDVEQMANVREVVFLPVGPVTGLDVNHGRALVTTEDSDQNFFLLDVEQPESTHVVHSSGIGTGATDVEAYFDTAFISTESGVYTLDTSGTPRVLGLHEADLSFTALDVSHGTLYAISEVSSTPVVIDPEIASSQVIRDVNADGEILISHLGDSNTAVYWSDLEDWSEVLQSMYVADGLQWRVDAESALGVATVADFGLSFHRVDLGARHQLARTFERSTPDAFIFAFVTNDIFFWSRGLLSEYSVKDITGAYRKHEETIAAVDPAISVFITTSPPHGLNLDRLFLFNISAMNDAIFEAYRANQVIDSFTALDWERDILPDGLHFTQSGHDLRAEQVFEKLTLDRQDNL